MLARRAADGLTYNRMVIDQPADAATDDVFRALADGTRRDILRRSADGDVSVSRLAEAYPMSFAAVHKHVSVLERAGLVTKVRSGREQLVRTEPEGLRLARRALDRLESTWRGRIELMSGLLDETGAPPSRTPTEGHDT